MADKHIIFHVEGGIGKNIMATAVAEAITKEHPDRKLIVVSSWAAAWVNNPHIERFYLIGGTPYFFEDYIKGKDTWVFKSEPYHHHDFLNGKRYLADIWCEIVHIRREDQLEIPGIDFMQTTNIRDLFALIDYSHNRLLIDSFGQHAAVALDRPSTVLWPIDNVKTLGYPDFHNNIISTADTRKVHLIDSYLGAHPINGEFLHECPFDNDNIFKPQSILDSLGELEEKEFYVAPKPPPSAPKKGTNRQKPKRRGK